MSDQINKTLILSAKLDTSGISGELKKLKSEAGSAIELDASSIASLKKELLEVAKAFSAELSKASKARVKKEKVSEYSPAEERYRRMANVGTPKDVANYQLRQSKAIAKAQNDQDLIKMREEQTRQRRIQKVEATMHGPSIPASLRREYLRNQERSSTSSTESGPFFGPNIPASLRKEHADRKRSIADANLAAMSMPEEQRQLQTEYQLRKKMQKQLADDKEEREKGVMYRVAKAARNFFDTGNFDFVQKSDSVDFRAKAHNLGIKIPEGSQGLAKIFGESGMLAGGTLGATAGLAGMAGVGAVGLAALMRTGAQRSRDTRSALANHSFATAMGVADNQVLETGIGRKVRQRMLPMGEGIESAFTGTLKDLFTLNFSDAISGKGAAAEESRRIKAEVDTRLDEVRPVLDAFNTRVSPNIGSRAGLLAGGSLTSGMLTGLQGVGANFGFGSSESLSRLQGARGILGNSFFAGDEGKSNFGMMSDAERRYGVDFGTQAGNLELIRSLGTGGLSGSQALNSQRDSLKRAVAAGLDASKTSKFLEVTSDYMAANSGFANMDNSRTTSSILSLARGFAANSGRSDLTNTDLERARSLSELTRSNSMSFGGISGAGNFVSISEGMSKAGVADSGMLANLMTFSKDATDEQLRSAMTGLTSDQQNTIIESFRSGKSNSFGTGLDALGISDPSFRNFLMSKENGLSGEGAQAASMAIDRGILPSGSVAEPIGALGSPEMSNLINQATVDFSMFVSGFKNINTVNELYTTQVKELVSALSKATDRANQFLDRSSAQAPRIFTGDELSGPRNK